jgi:outer membrane immunogenic protein
MPRRCRRDPRRYRADRSDLDGFLTDNSGWTATDTAFTAGAQIGYDWQFGAKVFGLVADWNWTNARATTVDDPNAPPTGFIRSEMDWFATLRTRSGVVVDNTLVYITGGLAAASIETSYSDSGDTFTHDKVRWGWTGGAGAEFALWSNWSATAEVLYMQFRKDSVTFNSPPNGGVSTFDNNDDAWVARVGLNYRWGGVGKAPVVAKF